MTNQLSKRKQLKQITDEKKLAQQKETEAKALAEKEKVEKEKALHKIALAIKKMNKDKQRLEKQIAAVRIVKWLELMELLSFKVKRTASS